jgi:cytochrome oxidase Cu insertion factor (SCO1/SenC/PrrC family)
MPGDASNHTTDLGVELGSSLLHGLLVLLVLAGCIAGSVALLRWRRHEFLHRMAMRWIGTSTGEPTQRKVLRIALGVLWLIDGALQAQPMMPAGFVPEIISPQTAAGPGWLATLVDPLATLWQQHPVTADAITVWLQLGLGLLILFSGWSGILQKVALWSSIAWGTFVWVAGESLGGLLTSGASWLMGAPGSAVVYVVAAALLLRAPATWSGPTIGRTIRHAVGAFFVAGAVVQAIPAKGNWTAHGLLEPFTNALKVAQPAWLSRPLNSTATLAADHPIAFNATLVALLAVIGIGLWVGSPRVFVPTGIVLCGLTWWLAQDFGVLGGMATDPNTGLPLAVLLASATPMRRPVARSSRRRTTSASRPLGWALTAGLTTIGLVTLIVIPVMLTVSMFGPADATAALADSGGGIVTLDQRPAPDFHLTDQRGDTVSLSGQRGKVVLLTFLDPVCSDECPVIANQLASVSDELGSLAARLEIVAIDTNPVFHNVADVAAFTQSHGLDGLTNWHFLAGSPPDVQSVLRQYGIGVEVPSVGMISHSEGIFFLSTTGTRVAYLGDGANPDLNTSYSSVIAGQIRQQLQ